MSLTLTRAGVVEAPAAGARLLVVGGPTLDLPWWPDDVEMSGLAPGYVDTDRPGRAALSTRSTEPLPTLRVGFTVSGTYWNHSQRLLLDAVTALAAARPLTRLVLGQRDTGLWQVRDAGWVESDWTDDGDPAEAEVTIELKRAAAAVDPVGPIKRRPRR